MATVVSRPLYVLERPTFHFQRLASQAGRAPVGGGREAALALYLVARMAYDTMAERGIEPGLRRARANAALSWLTSVALPGAVRTAITELVSATASSPREVAPRLRAAIAAAAELIDPDASLELLALASALESCEDGATQPLAGSRSRTVS